MASTDEDRRACQMLSNLHAACLAADTDKVTERKKQIAQIKLELNRSQVIGALNYGSENHSNKRQMLSWQRLFTMVKDIFVRDVKALLVAKERQQSSYQKLQQEALYLVKTVVKLACRGTDIKLKPSVVVQLLIELLEDDSGCEMFGVEFTNIVLRDMLSKRQYWYHLDKKLSHSLLSHYCRIFSATSSVRFDRSILSKSLHIILLNMVQHHDINSEELFSTLMQYFSGLSGQDDSLMVIEHMVCTTNIACLAVAVDQRINVCKLGEGVFLQLLTIWKKKKPSEKLKDELVKFYQLQMALHHPRGSRQGTDAAFAVDWCTWKRNLLQLYDAVYQELDEMKCRTRFSSSNSKDAAQFQLKDNLLQLAADLCHQLLADGGSVAELTQISQCSGTQYGNASKRRRIETGWMLILEKIMTSADALHTIPWLQLVSVILQKYPESVSVEEQLSLLPSLQQLLADCKNVDVSGWLLRCLLSFTNAFVCDPLSHLDESSRQLVAVWHRVYASAKRFLNIRHLQDDTLNLLISLMKKKIFFPDVDMWTLFRPGGIALSNSSVLFLTTYISLHGVPGSYCPDVTKQPGSSPLRLSLLEWMFPEIDPDTDWSMVDRSNVTDAHCLASSAVALSIRDAQSIIQELPFEESARVSDRWLDVEWCLRAMSFDVLVTAGNRTKRLEVTATPSVLQHVAQRVLELLHRDISYHLENSSPTSPELKMLESVAYQCCLSTKILNSLQRFWTTDFSKIQTLVNELKNLMTTLTDSLSKFIQTSGGITQLATIVQTLRDMVRKAPNEAEDGKSDLSDVCQTIVPDRLIQLLLDQMSDAKSRLRSSVADSDDIFASTSMMTGIDDDFDMSASQASSESMTDANTNASDNLSAFSPMLLSDKEKIRLLIADFLCHWSQRDSSRTDRNLNLRSDKESVMKKLVDFVDEEKSDWSVKEPYHLQLLQNVVCGLTSDVSSLPDVIVENLVDSLRLVCKHCASDQDACCAIMDMLGRLVPHLCSADEEVSESMKQSRKIAVQMHGVFWKRAVEGMYCGRTKLAIVKALISFIECDPENVWTIWTLRDLNKEMRTELPRLLQDPHLSVRLLVASAVPSFFGKTVNEKYRPSSREVQNQVFEEVIESLQQLLNTQGATGTTKFLMDSFQTAVCSCVQMLNGVIRTSEVCRKRATFVLLQMTKEQHFDINLVKKMLCQTAIHLRYADLRSFFEDHLPCLLKYWIENSYDFQDFPYQLLIYDSSTAFCRIHYKTIVTQLMTQLKLESLDEISSLLGTDRRSLLERCLPSIVVHILPLFAANKAIQNGIPITDGSIKKRLPQAVQCYDVLVKELGQQLVEKSILENMEQIVVGVLMSLHETNRNNDDATTFAYFSDSDPEPNPPTFNTSVIMTTLDYVTQSHSANASSIVNLMAQWQDGIQKVLLSLRTHISTAHTTNEKCRILSIYSIFIRLLLKDFPNQLGGCWAFVLRDIIYTSLHCIQQQLSTRSSMDLWSDRSVDLLVICCDLLKTTLKQTIRVCNEEIQKYLAFIIGSIGTLVGLREDLNKKCEEIINVIYVENSHQLQSTLPRLDPLPRSSIFQQANDVFDKIKSNQDLELKEEVEQFLRVGRFYSKTVVFGACNIRMEGLQHLSSQLVTRRQELARLVPTSDEDKRPIDTLCHLIKDLVRMVSHTDHASNSEFGLEVTKCIGTIGLIDMHFDGSRIEKQANGSGSEVLDAVQASFSNDFRKQRYCHIFHALNDFLIDSDIETVTTASGVLKQILTTKTGMQFVSTYKTRHPNDPLFLYLQPFLSAKKKHVSLPDQKDEFASLVDVADLWCPSLVNHNTWLRRLVSALINSGGVKDEILRCLNPVCQSQTKFCELVLPFIIHDILSSDENQSEQLSYRKTLSDQISSFFQKHCSFHAQKPSLSTEQGGQVTNKESVRTLLNVTQYLRLQERSPTATQWHNNFWLEIDYRYLSQAALNCSSYYTSLLYCDISDLQNGKQNSSAMSSGPASSGQDAENIDIQEILLEAYRSISDSDSIYGCAVNQRHMDHFARTKMYEHENNWMKAMTSHDLSISHLSSDSVSLSSYAGLAKSLNNLGCDHLLDVYLQGLLEKRGRGGNGGGRDGLCRSGGVFGGSGSPTEDDIKEIQYQAASRSCKWDLDIPNRLDDRDCSYSQLVYSSMVGLKQKDGGLVSEGISAARRLLLGSLLNRTGEESESSLYPIISRLQSVSELEDFSQCLVQRSNVMDGILTRWTNQEPVILRQEYDDIEPILINRCTMMRLACDDQPQSEMMHNGLVQSLVTLVTAARKAGRYQVAGGALYKLDALSSTSKFPVSYDWKVEEARLFWAKGEVETAKYLLKNLIDSMERLVNPEDSVSRLYAQSLVVYGNWLAKTRSESPSIILDKFIRKGTSLLEENGTCDDEVSVDAFLSFARYADGQYQTIVDYMKSDTFDAKQSLIRQAKDDIDQMKRLGDTASRYFRTLEKQRQIDEEELKRLRSDREQFMIYAVENYIKCLQHHDCHDQYVYRLTSLWFDNMTCQAVNQRVKEAGQSRIKSHKFISLMYQLAARMSCRMDGETGPFQATLTQLIETVVVDHPHHCLSIILSLANAKRDSEVPKAKTRGRPSTADSSQETETDEDRVLAAKKMLMRLQKKKGNKIGGIVSNMDKLCAAYIQLANWNVDRYKGETKPVNLPETLLIMQIEELPNVAVTTVNVPVDPTCQYKDFIYVARFQPTFTLAGGINLPKIISCRGSDGVQRRQLVKGKDDLRQDAVMQQVFMMVNDLLKKNPETRKRHLNIRTYKVVPLSQRSGILEWCEGTLPMGEYLIGSTNGAHQRYRPSDLKAMECRKLLSKAHADGSDQAKYQTFRHVCSQFHPVFRHFFMERYRHPIDWYHRKLSYTRSVATNSIVGYILGLGDRHVQNILIDTQTAELIHIDLGVAFEQGRILPTPETVPFRLTRDIVDGMGVMGVEGVFRRCCEKTMEVMHSSEEVIITILQVLLYDPLYSWTMSPIKAYQLQSNKTIENDPSVLDTTNMTDRRTKSDSQDNVNKVAERVLLRLKQKLQGTEDGVQLSISGQVNHLIQEATDPKNLCRLFPGWQAYI